MSVILIGPSIPSSSTVLLSALSALFSKSRPDMAQVDWGGGGGSWSLAGGVGVVGAARAWGREDGVAAVAVGGGGGANGALDMPFEGEWDGVAWVLALCLASEAQKSSYVFAAPERPPVLPTERVGDGLGVDREGEG
jgi:hypothetical protein